jgi:HAD superfamily hydrolase (TIGR01549 family)
MMTAGVVWGRIDTDRIKGLLFDVDGTLSDTDDHMVDKISRSLRGISWLFRDHNPKPFARWLVMAVETPANFIYHLTDRLGADKFFIKTLGRFSGGKKNLKASADQFWLIPGSREMLAALKDRFRMAVVSARDLETTIQFLEHFNLLEFFDLVVTSQSCEHTKPFPDPVHFAARELGLDPGQCLMVGDTVVDITAGKAAGAQTAAVLCGFGTERELARAGADLILTATTDLQNVLALE